MDSMTERSATVEAARDAAIDATFDWGRSYDGGSDKQIAGAKRLAYAALDAFGAACRAEGAAEMLREMPCEDSDGDYWQPCYSDDLCRTCAARAEKASAG